MKHLKTYINQVEVKFVWQISSPRFAQGAVQAIQVNIIFLELFLLGPTKFNAINIDTIYVNNLRIFFTMK